jgi:phospholipase C
MMALPTHSVLLLALTVSLTHCSRPPDDSHSLATWPSEQREYAGRWSRCEFGAGQVPAETLPTSAPRGQDLPFDHFVVVMQENRSFDHYFGRLPVSGVRDVAGAPDSFSNPDPASPGTSVAMHHADTLCLADLGHGWNTVHRQVDGGKMDGFYREGGRRALAYYDERDLPYYYALARSFAVADRYFSSMLGPTFPNRMFALSGTSFGHIENTDSSGDQTQRTLFHQLTDAGISWMIYHTGNVFEVGVFQSLLSRYPAHFAPISQLYADAAAGRLPARSWVESSMGGSTDEHPPLDIQIGQQFVAGVIASLTASPQWPRAALFLLYDEHGGFFDHLPPPAACLPDRIAPMIRSGDVAATFDRYGVRVPFVAVSPWSRPGYVSHETNSHTSLLRLIQTRFGLPAMTARDANSNALLELFDFEAPPRLAAPSLPAATVDAVQSASCSVRPGD